MNTSQEVYEDIDTDESSHSVLSGQNETSMQDVERSVDVEEYDDNDFDFLSRERISRYTKLSANFDINDFERSESEPSTDNDSDDSVNNRDNDSVYNGPHEIFEDYSCPPLELFQNEIVTSSIHNNQFLWILLWVMNFRKRFNVPETATETLIKFMKLVLTEVGSEDSSTFPESLYLARNVLGLKDHFQAFVPCPKCHKLYEKHEVENFRQGETPTIMKCHHVEFPNSSRC
jgi:hypothetical protein